MTWFASIRMLLQHFPRKVGLHGPARRCVSGVKAVYRPLRSSRHLPDAREQQQRIPYALYVRTNIAKRRSSRVCGFPDREVCSRFL